MKKSLFIVAALVAACGVSVHAEPDDRPQFKVVHGRITYESVQALDLTKKEIIAHASAFIAEKFRSAKSVIELRDDELGKIVGDVILRDPDAGSWAAFTGVKVRLVIDAKDGRYRVQATNVVAVDQKSVPSPFGDIEGANRYRIEPMASKILPAFFTELHSYMVKAKTDDNW